MSALRGSQSLFEIPAQEDMGAGRGGGHTRDDRARYQMNASETLHGVPCGGASGHALLGRFVSKKVASLAMRTRGETREARLQARIVLLRNVQ